MTADEFRKVALSLPEATESAHMNHPDFRVKGKIFATLGPAGADWGMVKLTPQQQTRWVALEPAVFAPVKGGWGQKGATKVSLAAATEDVVRPALIEAWRNVAPKRLVQEREEDLER
jgi:hypothetical protein